MNHSYGILVFGFCFFTFLIWLWKYPSAGLLPEEESASTLAVSGSSAGAGLVVPMETVSEVDNWLLENGLQSLQGYMRTAGMYGYVYVQPIWESDTEL